MNNVVGAVMMELTVVVVKF